MKVADPFEIRQGGPADHAALAAVMHAAIHAEPSPYTLAERRAWSPQLRSGPDWAARLADQHIIIAEAGATATGFMTLAEDGYVDFAYIAADWRGRGIFRALHEAIEVEARRRGEPRLHTHASLMARPAFAAMGYACLADERIARDGQSLKRFVMEKTLS